MRNLTEVFAGTIWGNPIPLELPPELPPVLSDALHAVVETLRATNDGPRDSAPLDAAVAAVKAILHGMQELGAGATSLSPTAAIVIDLKCILVALRPGTERDSEESPSPVVQPVPSLVHAAEVPRTGTFSFPRVFPYPG